jgi:predicted Abi (CAAX) family protease
MPLYYKLRHGALDMQSPVIQLLVERLMVAWRTPATWEAWLFAAVLLGIYSLVTLPVAFRVGFTQVSPAKLSLKDRIWVIAIALVMPSIFEEVVFRVFMLPHPGEGATTEEQWIWGAIALIIFVLSHPLNSYTFFPASRATFLQPIFLLAAGFLGAVCSLSYLQSGSLWPPVVIHWIVVVIWLLVLGGHQKLYAE